MLRRLGILSIIVTAALAIGAVGVFARDGGGAPAAFPHSSNATGLAGPGAPPSADDDVAADAEQCNGGPAEASEFKLEIESQRVELKGGIVSSINGNTLQISSPGQTALVTITADLSTAEIEGAIEAGSVVELKGAVANGVVTVEKIEVVCPEAEEEKKAEACEAGEVAAEKMEDGKAEVECKHAAHVGGGHDSAEYHGDHGDVEGHHDDEHEHEAEE